MLVPKEEMLAVKINRLFAAARSLRGRNPAGYARSCKELEMIREQLDSEDADAMGRIMGRVDEMSNGTFYWDP